MAVNLKAKLRLYLFIVFLLIGIAGAAFFVRLKLQKTTVPAKTAQQDVNPENKKANRLNNNPPPQSQAVNSAVNPVTQAAVQAGVLTSINRINQVVNYLTRGSQSGACMFVDKAAPDRRIFSTSLEIILPNTPSIYATASFAPNPQGLSDAVYETVQYLDESRDSAAKRLFKGAKPTSILKKDIFFYDTGSAKFFLMPAGKGCVVIKKEVLY